MSTLHMNKVDCSPAAVEMRLHHQFIRQKEDERVRWDSLSKSEQMREIVHETRRKATRWVWVDIVNWEVHIIETLDTLASMLGMSDKDFEVMKRHSERHGFNMWKFPNRMGSLSKHF